METTEINQLETLSPEAWERYQEMRESPNYWGKSKRKQPSTIQWDEDGRGLEVGRQYSRS